MQAMSDEKLIYFLFKFRFLCVGEHIEGQRAFSRKNNGTSNVKEGREACKQLLQVVS